MGDAFVPLDQLRGCKWRDIEFPISSMKLSIAHDLVEHKYWGVNGARVEDTGVAPMRIHATIPLLNGIFPGFREFWDPILYPKVMRLLVNAFVQRRTGPFIHPEFGQIPCKAEHFDIQWDPMKRGGCEAEATWVQTLDDKVERKSFASPVTDLNGAVETLDAQWVDLKALVPQIDDSKTFEGFIEGTLDAISGGFDQVALTTSRITAPLERIEHRAKLLRTSVERARTALGWKAVDSTHRIEASIRDARRQVAEKRRSIRRYRVPTETTLAAVQAALPGTTIAELMVLNPQLMLDPAVPAHTLVRYYDTPEVS